MARTTKKDTEAAEAAAALADAIAGATLKPYAEPDVIGFAGALFADSGELIGFETLEGERFATADLAETAPPVDADLFAGADPPAELVMEDPAAELPDEDPTLGLPPSEEPAAEIDPDTDPEIGDRVACRFMRQGPEIVDVVGEVVDVVETDAGGLLLDIEVPTPDLGTITLEAVPKHDPDCPAGCPAWIRVVA